MIMRFWSEKMDVSHLLHEVFLDMRSVLLLAQS